MPRLRFTLKAWPVIAIATIGLTFLTEQAAKLYGVELPEQTNLEIVKRCFANAFASAKAFGVAAFLVAQIVVIMPVLEELVFRGLLFKLPNLAVARMLAPSRVAACILAVLSSALFSAAHYLTQSWPDNAFVALFFFGLAQCWLYRRTDRIGCPMLNHALFNTTNLVLLFLVPEGA